jgi:hypothetical protein
MSRLVVFVLAAFSSLYVQVQAFAQLTPPAGSAGAGSSGVNGVPFGPANPRVLSDPSGIGNASSLPPLRTNPVPTVSSIPSSPAPVVAPIYPSAPRRVVSAHEPRSKEPRGKTSTHHRAHPHVSTFTGICRGC